MKDYYAILEVPKDTDRDEIKRSYLEHVCFVHPDRFEKGSPDWTNATNLLLDINEAYQCLGDPEKRKEYDLMSEESGNGASAAPLHLAAPSRVPYAILLVSAALLLVYYYYSSHGHFFWANPNETTQEHTIPPALADEKKVAEEGNPEVETPTEPQPKESSVLLGVSRERPRNTATRSNSFQYIQLGSDDFYETLLEVDSSVIYQDRDIAAIWTKHIRNEMQENGLGWQDPEGVSVDTSNIGWFITLDAYDLLNDTLAMLKIIYFDKFGSVIGGYDVPNERIRTIPVTAGSAEHNTLSWIKTAVKKTNGQADQRQRAIQIGRIVTTERNKTLNTEGLGKSERVENYIVKKGGIIIVEYCFTRKLPAQDTPAVRGKLLKDTPVFVSKRYRDDEGKIWYYVEHIQAKGWISNRSLRIY